MAPPSAVVDRAATRHRIHSAKGGINSPLRTSGKLTSAFSYPITMSHRTSISAPPPRAGPLRAAINGLRIARRETLPKPWGFLRTASVAGGAFGLRALSSQPLRSWPAQKVLLLSSRRAGQLIARRGDGGDAVEAPLRSGKASGRVRAATPIQQTYRPVPVRMQTQRDGFASNQSSTLHMSTSTCACGTSTSISCTARTGDRTALDWPQQSSRSAPPAGSAGSATSCPAGR